LPNRKVIAGIVLAVLALTIWYFLRPAPDYELLAIRQFTFDPGLTGWPAISPDGRMVAYASDRDTGSNLELYMQPIQGGSPARITQGVDNNSEPAFSPGGAALAFSSTGGGIFTFPVMGGNPRLIAPGGHTPRYSPDGRWIAYSDAAGAYVVASTGGAPRRFHPELKSVSTPAWSPDGSRLVFWAQDDLWVAPRDGGTVESTGIGPRLAKARIGRGPFDDALWTNYGLIFSARTGFARNLYRCRLGPDGKTTGDVVRLTNGTGLVGDASVSREGRMVFSSGSQRFDI
jgi:dipeptidyl aminopeptidase/acylaminoacyl peptidase